MNKSKILSISAVLMAAFALSASAQTVLIDEDFNNPAVSANNSTPLGGTTTYFPEWNWNEANAWKWFVDPQDGVPVSAGDGFVKVDRFGTTNAQYDTGHNWSATDQFTLSLNATEQSWESGRVRNMVVSIKETARTGDTLTGAELWTVTEELILDTNHDGDGEGWGPNNTFSWTFNAADFTTGTEGNAISFQIGSGTGDPGYYFDNVILTVVPEPSAFALLSGLFGLVWVMLRRRRQ